MASSPVSKLLNAVASRLWLARLGHGFRRNARLSAVLLLLALAAARLLGLFSLGQNAALILLVPGLALVGALAFSRKPTAAESARALDSHTGAKDLFLTATLIGPAPAGNAAYAPLVLRDAEERAAAVQLGGVVPLAPWRGLGETAAWCAALAVAIVWMPQLDPFGSFARETKKAEQISQITQIKKQLELRAEQLAASDGDLQKKVQAAFKELDRTLKEAKPADIKPTQEKLAALNKDLGELWRKADAGLPKKDAFQAAAQQVGQQNSELEKATSELKKGNPAEMQKALEAAKQALQKAAEAAKQNPGSQQAAEAQRAAAQQLAALSQAAQAALGKNGMSEAMQKALEALAKSGNPQAQQQALEAAAQAAQLSQQELQQLVESMASAKDLEDAMKTLQQASSLCQGGKLDGEKCGSCNSLADYQALFNQLAGQGQNDGAGSGPGQGGRGQGQGAIAEEDDSGQTNMKTERASTHLGAGKILMQWKTNELGPKGDRTGDFKAAISEVKQGVSEAINADQVPPGYHGGIQKYFDSLPAK